MQQSEGVRQYLLQSLFHFVGRHGKRGDESEGRTENNDKTAKLICELQQRRKATRTLWYRCRMSATSTCASEPIFEAPYLSTYLYQLSDIVTRIGGICNVEHLWASRKPQIRPCNRVL
jgi:hypothetical protein